MAEKNEERMQVCKSCGRELPLSEFRASRLGLLKTCKDCVRRHQVDAKEKKRIIRANGEDVEKARRMRLAEFHPRELMAELKRRGYKYKMEYTETHVIDSKDIEI